jgi:hypothetical protein
MTSNMRMRPSRPPGTALSGVLGGRVTRVLATLAGARRGLATGLAALALCGCNALPAQHAAPAPQRSESPSDDRDVAAAMLMADIFQTMQRLAQSPPAEQAEILATAREAYQHTPQGGAQLRYALLLATPGHPGRNPQLAQQLLRDLVAEPEMLVPIERAVALVELSQLNREIELQASNERVQTDATRLDQEHSVTAQRRLQAEIDENAALRKALDAAQAKLDAIATIERNLAERKPNAPASEVHQQ